MVCACRYDLIGNFAKAMAAGGVNIGFYYSLTNNFFMNVAGKVAKGSDGWLPGMAVSVIFLPLRISLSCWGVAPDVERSHQPFHMHVVCRRTSARQISSA